MKLNLRDVESCEYGDETCPCNDGDPCHYEGENPMSATESPEEIGRDDE